MAVAICQMTGDDSSEQDADKVPMAREFSWMM